MRVGWVLGPISTAAETLFCTCGRFLSASLDPHSLTFETRASVLQLSAVIDRLLAQPVTAPLKAMLTGVELLLAKGQVRAGLLVACGCLCVQPSAELQASVQNLPYLVQAPTCGLSFPRSPSLPAAAAVGGDGCPAREPGPPAGPAVGAGHALAPSRAGGLAWPAGQDAAARGRGGPPGARLQGSAIGSWRACHAALASS